MSRFGYFVTTYLMALAIGVFSLFHHTPRLMWNASASTPVGLYSLNPAEQLRVGDLVADQPAPALSRFMATRHYLPLGVPLLKYVGALPGQTVCRQDLQVSVDGLVMAMALTRDSAHRPLPVWQGCRTLKYDEIFLLNPAAPDSFDGRYFGVLPLSTVTARAVPLWTESVR
jgi:conjugative transfer signal peptidase TraF